MSNGTNTAVPNPDVYLNHLLPGEAKQFEIARNMYIAVLGAVACDVLSYIPDDIRTLKRLKGLSCAACFILARIFALTFMALWITMATTPVSNCRGMNIASNLFHVMTMAAVGFLFLRRVQAVYADNRFVRWLFTFLWVGTCGVVFALVPGTKGDHIPGTGYCLVHEAIPYVPLANFMPAIFDTLVFIAVSYRLAFQTNQELQAQKSWTTSWFSTKRLPRLQRAMNEGGQQYFFVAFILQLVGGIVSIIDAVPPVPGKMVCTVPAVALSACLACRAHRIVVDAYYRSEEGTVAVMSTMSFTPNPSYPPKTVTELEGGMIVRKGSGSMHSSF